MSYLSLASLFSTDLAIDLGTVNTLVYARGQGVVLDEPSVVAVNRKTGEVEAIGSEAEAMIGRTPGEIDAFRPLKDGVIADFTMAEKMLHHFVRKVHNRKLMVKPGMVMGVRGEITPVAKRAVRDSAYRANAREVHLVDQAMMAALGAGLPVSEPSGSMVVDVGGGATDVAVISLAGVVLSHSIGIAGNAMDHAIADYLRRKYNLLVGERTAEAVKIAIGSAHPLDPPRKTEVRGRDLLQGMPKAVTVGNAEIREAIEPAVKAILGAIRLVLERVPPELSADIGDSGVVLTGGGAMLQGLDTRIRQETGLSVSVAADPLKSVVTGAGQVLNDSALLNKISIN